MPSESVSKLRIYPRKKYLEMIDIMDSLFKTTEKTKDDDTLSTAALKLIEKAAKRGDEGLWCSDWKEHIKELDISHSQYFHILRVLKNSQIITRSKGKFYLITGFGQHLSLMAATFNMYMNNKGVLRIE